MIRYEPFRAGHLAHIRPQSAQHGEAVFLFQSGLGAALERGQALTAFNGLLPIACAGVSPLFSHRAVAWAIFSIDAGPHMLALCRKMRRMIDALPYARVEMNVREGHVEGEKLAVLLGMRKETPIAMKGFGLDGEAQYMYAVVKG